ncbi:MAG: DNA mismatch repair endonuclease MutL [Flavobacteriales bacterium]
MSDRIALLPDSVANQIAAGEVVQRPASVVKELLENAIDAEAKGVDLIIKDAGRTAIQVVDDGCGMSPTDARLSFARHATSKIKTTADLFQITTKGFRGEALAAIAAVAQVEMKSKTEGAETATFLQIEGSEVKKQEPIQAAKGTAIAVKKLFYNVPARRNFLKSDPIELRHIIDEFERIALAHSQVGFRLLSNGKELFHLPPENLRQRIVHIFGKKMDEKLVPIAERTKIIQIAGFIGKSDAARKKRGEQFFFVNRRFIKNPYLNHGILAAYEGLLTPGSYPPYFIFFAVDPGKVDVNIHPTKTEIKFEDEKSIYSILRSSVRHALGMYNVTPTLDFSSNPDLEISQSETRTIRQPQIRVDRDFNPFANSFQREKVSPAESQAWRDLYRESGGAETEVTQVEIDSTSDGASYMQVHKQYILVQTQNGLLLIHQYRAHQRVLYDKFLKSLQEGRALGQRLLFPVAIELSPSDIQSFDLLSADLRKLGFDFELKKSTLRIRGAPTELEPENIAQTLEKFLEQAQSRAAPDPKLKEATALTIASQAAIRKGHTLTVPEMQRLVNALFASRESSFSPQGKRIYNTLPLSEITRQFHR